MVKSAQTDPTLITVPDQVDRFALLGAVVTKPPMQQIVRKRHIALGSVPAFAPAFSVGGAGAMADLQPLDWTGSAKPALPEGSKFSRIPKTGWRSGEVEELNFFGGEHR